MPLERRVALFIELDGKPDIATVDWIFRSPAVGEKNEGVGPAEKLLDECALRVECGFDIVGLATAWIFQRRVRAEYLVCNGQAGRVGRPTRSARGDQEILVIVLQQRGDFVEAARQDVRQ